MKILGIGVDIIDNKRIKESIKNNKFKRRIYTWSPPAQKPSPDPEKSDKKPWPPPGSEGTQPN